MQQCSCGDELVLLAAALAISVAKGRSADDINILAAFITAVGDNLALIAATRVEGTDTTTTKATNTNTTTNKTTTTTTNTNTNTNT